MSCRLARECENFLLRGCSAGACSQVLIWIRWRNDEGWIDHIRTKYVARVVLVVRTIGESMIQIDS